jgi:hypothetical protein
MHDSAAIAAGLSTIVSNHPMMRTLECLAMLNSGVPGTARMFASSQRFAFLRTFVDGSPARHSDLRYVRELVANGSVAASLAWDDAWLVDPYHQMALVADRAGQDRGYRYTLQWMNGIGTTATVANLPTTDTFLQVSGLQAGDSVLLGLRGYVGSTVSPTLAVDIATAFVDATGDPRWDAGVVPASASSTMGGLAPNVATTTTYYAQTATGGVLGVLWIRVVVGQSKANGDVQGDGRGVAMRITR